MSATDFMAQLEQATDHHGREAIRSADVEAIPSELVLA